MSKIFFVAITHNTIIQNNNVLWFCVTPQKIAYYPQGAVYLSLETTALT